MVEWKGCLKELKKVLCWVEKMVCVSVRQMAVLMADKMVVQLAA